MTFNTCFSFRAVNSLYAHRTVNRFYCIWLSHVQAFFSIYGGPEAILHCRLFDKFILHAIASTNASGCVLFGCPANAKGFGSSIIVTLKSVVGIAVPGIAPATTAWPPFPALTHLALTTSSAIQTSLQVVDTVRLRVSMTTWQWPSAVRLKASASAKTYTSIHRAPRRPTGAQYNW